MPKIFVSILIICLACGKTVAQEYGDDLVLNIRHLFGHSVDWDKDNQMKLSASGEQLISTILLDSNLSFRHCDDAVWLAEVKLAFHFLDIDGDRDRDVIFNERECMGLESESVLVFMNVRGYYKLMVNCGGRIAKFEPSKGFIIHQYPCCGDIRNEMVAYQIGPDTLQLVNGISFFRSPFESAFPEHRNMFPQDLIPSKELTIQRGTPVLYSPQNEFPKGGPLQDNFLSKVKMNTTCTVYSSFEDTTGTMWFYCLLSPSHLETIWKFGFPVLGWVK